MIWVIVVVVLLVLLGLFLVLTYNRLVRFRNRSENAWAQVDVQLKRRADLIPNLVETVKGYASHERETFDEVTRARTAAQQAQGVAETAQAAPEAIVKELMTKPLPESPGKEALMISVEYPPGAVDPVHRHDAQAFVYVLEGTIVMQLQGGKAVTLKPGDTFYEGPDDIHTVGRNASNTKRAKFIVLLLKDKGKPVLTPVK